MYSPKLAFCFFGVDLFFRGSLEEVVVAFLG
jgi:hypothetical protein